MDTPNSIDYFAIFGEMVRRHASLTEQRSAIEVEVAKLRQLILATFPLIPEEEQQKYQPHIEELEAQTEGLLNAIKLVFSAHKGEWFTPLQMRDQLVSMGFDLTQYRANPLASITTTLKRMVPGRIESKTVDGQVMYRRHLSLLDLMGRQEYGTHIYAPVVSQDESLKELERGYKKLVSPAKLGTSPPAPPAGFMDVIEDATQAMLRKKK